MKLKSIITLLFIVLTLSPLAAQKHQKKTYPQQQQSYGGYNNSRRSQSSIEMIYGVAAGITCPIVNIKGNDADVSGNVGFKVGMMWGVDFGIVEFVPELWYSSFKLDFNSGSGDLTGAQLRNRSIDIPLLVGVKLSDSFRLNLGPTFSLMCNNEVTLKNYDVYDFGRIKNSVGYVVGVSYDIINNLFIDLRYSGRLTANSTYWNSSSDPYSFRMYSIDVTAGFRF